MELYEMIIDYKTWFLPIDKAGVAYNSYTSIVEIGKLVILNDGSTRAITWDDHDKIRILAEEYAAHK